MLFHPYKLDYENPDNKRMNQLVVKMFNNVFDLSNVNIVKNADRLLASKTTQEEVEWAGKDKKRLLENRYKMSYYF